jgi:hypothetical protein
MKFWWLFLMPSVGLSPVLFRYLRIQGKTNPFLKEVCSHTTGKILSSFVPLDGVGPLQDIIKDTVYVCVENKTLIAEYIAKQLLVQFISHEINDGLHEVVDKITHH